MRRIFPAALLALFAALFLLPLGARGDGFSSGGVTWPLSVPTGLGAVAQIVGPTDQTFLITSGASGGITVKPADAAGSFGGPDVLVTGGLSTSLSGGPGGGRVVVTGGAASGTSPGGAPFGGAVLFTGGASGTYSLAAGGDASLIGGVSNGAVGTGGASKITGGAGNVSGANGGVAQVSGGAGNGAGAGGSVTITPGMSGSGADGSVILRGSSAHTASTVITIAGTALTFATDPFATTQALTAGTLTVENAAAYRRSVSSFTWTNAQVVALGAALTGDLTVGTLPAKTVLLNAYVVITGAATGPATLTVALGRTSAAYVDYIVASDARAAANTVYGDASGERGTNLTGYDLPSYTGTIAVKLHFIATVSNLDQTLASTGRVILETAVIP